MGKNHRILKSPSTPEKVHNRMWEKLTMGQTWKGELANLTKDGKEFWVDPTITPVLGPDGQTVKYIGVSFDITKQKLQSQRIKEALQQAESNEAGFREQIEALTAQLAAAPAGTAAPADLFAVLEESFPDVLTARLDAAGVVERALPAGPLRAAQGGQPR